MGMDARYPLSQWYLRPAAGWLASALVATPVRPNWLSAAGLLASGAAAAVLLWQPELAPLAALLVLGAWFFDRADGQLARLQGTTSRLGAWLDANFDELQDLGLHVAIAAAASRQWSAQWPWALLVAFLAGKYLLMYGLAAEEGLCAATPSAGPAAARRGRLASLYHLPGNADVRVHVLVVALAFNQLAAELALVALYYNFRWLARYALVARRWGGVR